MSGRWVARRFCECGDGWCHQVAFDNPWFFSDALCVTCGEYLRYSTVGRRVRWRGMRLGILRHARKGFWEIHPDDGPLPFETGGLVRHAEARDA